MISDFLATQDQMGSDNGVLTGGLRNSWATLNSRAVAFRFLDVHVKETRFLGVCASVSKSLVAKCAQDPADCSGSCAHGSALAELCLSPSCGGCGDSGLDDVPN
jgi:hypothetical protein